MIKPMRPRSPLPRDTTAEAMRVQLDALRRLGGIGRLRLAFDLGESLRQTVEAGVRQRHPDHDDRTVRLAVTRLTIGDRLFRLAYPGVWVDP
jgi:hypothetical protein